MRRRWEDFGNSVHKKPEEPWRVFQEILMTFEEEVSKGLKESEENAIWH